MSKIVVVLGMHRSGTSMIAHLLNRLGVYLGDDLLAPDANNPLGYFEDTEILGLNKAILSQAGGSWKNPPAQHKLQAISPRLVDKMRTAVTRRANLPLWGFKDPRTCLTAHLWHPLLKEVTRHVYYVNVLRNGADVVRSLEAAHGKHPAGAWDQVVVHYQMRVAEFIRNKQVAALSISYTTIMRDPSYAKQHLLRIANSIDLPVTRDDVATAVADVIKYPQEQPQ